ncbi:MAG: hypothetical protein GY780_15930 [bacterium]|nr:hypothetical protein [bacterium]
MSNKTNAIILFFVGVGLMTAGAAMGYTTFSGSNNCDQCHDGFDGYGSSTHQEHISSFSCGSCHASSGDNPLVETCAVCHEANLLWNFHLQFAPNDMNGFNCATCHNVVATEKDTWDGIKARYREALFTN